MDNHTSNDAQNVRNRLQNLPGFSGIDVPGAGAHQKPEPTQKPARHATARHDAAARHAKPEANEAPGEAEAPGNAPEQKAAHHSRTGHFSSKGSAQGSAQSTKADATHEPTGGASAPADEPHDTGVAKPVSPVTRGYRAPADDPYGRSGAPIRRVTGGAVPIEPQQHVSRASVRRALLILLGVFAIVGGIWAFAWFTRSVTFTLDGETVPIRVNSTIDQVIAQRELTFKPGNLVSVTGQLLQEGEGHPYTVIMGDKTLSPEEAADLRIQGGETIELKDGTDATEPFTTEVEEVQPKLLMQGNWGSLGYVSQWGKVGKQEYRVGSMSGERAPGEVLQQVQDCIIAVRNPDPAGDHPMVALTFDDGPSVYTDRILDVLKKYGAHATFFTLGPNVAKYPEQAKHIVSSGNQIASHTQNHKDLTTLTPEELQSELKTAFGAIKDATDTTTTTIRPPYGSIRQRTWLNSGGLMSLSVLWSADSRDWSMPGANAIVNNSLIGLTNGSIILMHDGGGDREQTIQALPQLIEKLQADGYELVTISELLAADPSVPADIATGAATLPEGCVWPTELVDA